MGSVIRNVIRDVIRPVMGDEALVSRFSPAARDYFARLDAAGLRVTTYDAANARLIDRLVANGGNFWPDSGAFNAMAGYLFPTGGTLIPLKDGHDAGTLNAFVTGDWNAVTGLKGDGSTKYVDSGRAGNADGQNDIALGVYNSQVATQGTASVYVGSGGTSGSATHFGRSGTAPEEYFSRNRSNAVATVGNSNTSGHVASSRSEAAEYILYGSGASISVTELSTSPVADNHGVFARIDGVTAETFSDGRIPFYHIGPNLSGAGELAELDSILTDWQTDLANA